MSTTNERAEAFLADVLPRIEALGQESLARVRQTTAEASADAARYAEAEAELEEVEAQIASLSAERAGLPERAFRAALEEDWTEEDELKVRYKNLRPALESLGDRRASLKGELSRLLRNPKRHPNDVAIERYGKEAKVAFQEREALEKVRKRVVEALDEALKPVQDAHEGARAMNENLGRQRAWDESPVGRGLG